MNSLIKYPFKKILSIFEEFGRFIMLIVNVFRSYNSWSVYLSNSIDQMIIIGTNSIPIVILTSFFTGMVSSVQASYQMESTLTPKWIIGSLVGETMLLELAPVITSLVLAGRIGATIAAELGTMRVTEQIDALEVMGINSINYLVFPKVIALLLYPFLISIAMFLGILGGMIACVYGGYSTMSAFIEGIQTDFIPFHMTYAFIKSFVFAFILATVPSFHGYYMKGGALEVGKASTKSFIWTSVSIVVFNFLITQMLLG